eukprot:scaffold6456_cov98-Skeletonema_dohrnii-CCMP3373.AAC.2
MAEQRGTKANKWQMATKRKIVQDPRSKIQSAPERGGRAIVRSSSGFYVHEQELHGEQAD